KETDAFALQPWQYFYTYFSTKTIGKCIISSTVEIPQHIIQYLKSKAAEFIYLDETTPLPIQNIYKTKTTLGKDRIALAVGAAQIYPGKNILVVNTGTCVTYNILSKGIEFVGGAISPGLQMRLQAMHTFTAQLPQPEIDEEKDLKLIGTTTDESLLSGAINGLTFEIEGYINHIQEQYFPLKVILSGGDSRYVAKHLNKTFTKLITVEPHLALSGLNQILHFNGKS
ncbi:MAG: type III pantothenate kinase, partial [Bacteroidia bacterium]